MTDTEALELRLIFGEALRRRREDLGLSQRAVAKQYGLTHRIICGAENGSINMTIRTMVRLAAAVDGEIPEMLTP